MFNPILRNTDLHLDVPHWELAPEIVIPHTSGNKSGSSTTILSFFFNGHLGHNPPTLKKICYGASDSHYGNVCSSHPISDTQTGVFRSSSAHLANTRSSPRMALAPLLNELATLGAHPLCYYFTKRTRQRMVAQKNIFKRQYVFALVLYTMLGGYI